MSATLIEPMVDPKAEVERDRGTGRTSAMVRTLPDDGEMVAIIIHHRSFLSYICGLIAGLRGPEFLTKCSFIVADVNIQEHLQGIGHGRIFIDHAVWGFATPRIRELLQAAVWAAPPKMKIVVAALTVIERS